MTADEKKSEIDEATVFFEVVLPQLCEKYADGLRKLGPERSVEFHLRTRPPRSWVVTGGEGPWVKRGQAEGGEPDLVVTMTPDLVEMVVHGGEPNLDEAIEAGHLELDGKLDFMQELGLDLKGLT